MNIFERIFRRKVKSIDLSIPKLKVFKRIFAEKSTQLTIWSDFFKNTESYISSKDENVLGYWKNINKSLANLLFTGLMKLFFWIKLYKNNDWTNALNVVEDFDNYLYNRNFLNKKVKISESLILFGIVWAISTLLYFIYYIVYEIDMKGALPDNYDGFASFESLYASKITLYVIWIILFVLIYFIMNKILKNKILFFQKTLDAYMMNFLIYHYIFNSYQSEKLTLWYFYFKGIIENIINKLREDKVIWDQEYMLYLIFLWEPKNNSEFVYNKEIWNIIRLYYAYSTIWTQKWYDTVRVDLHKTYITNKKNYEIMLNEWRDQVSLISKLIWYATIFSIMGTLYFVIFSFVSIIKNWISY